jgi:hypothetical protein
MISSNTLKCKYCGVFKDRLKKAEAENKRLSSTISKLNVDIVELKKKIQEMTRSTQEREKLPVLDLSDQGLETRCCLFSREYFLKGIKGIALFVFNYILKNNKGELLYHPVDISRCRYQYNNGNELVVDNKFKGLMLCVFPILDKDVSKVYKECIAEFLRDNETDEKKRLTEIIPEEPKYKDEKETSSPHTSDGETTDSEKDDKPKSQRKPKEEDDSDRLVSIFFDWRKMAIKRKVFDAELEYLLELKAENNAQKVESSKYPAETPT